MHLKISVHKPFLPVFFVCSLFALTGVTQAQQPSLSKQLHLTSQKALFNQVVTLGSVTNTSLLTSTSVSLGLQVEQFYAFKQFQQDEIIGGVQNELKKLGYTYVITDGRVDGKTRRAITAFQKLNLISPTGQLTSVTYNRISSTSAVQISLADVDNNSSQVASIKLYAAQLGQQKYGWGGNQFQYLNAVWTDESGWNYQALNPKSGAYGIPQSLPANKMASVGTDWQTNPATQVQWGEAYIDSTYGYSDPAKAPEHAFEHEESFGWY